jgi:hypothetical protein
MLKTIFLNILKFALAFGLIGWLLQSGKLDFKLLQNLSQYPFSIIMACVLSVLNFWLISLRWRSILRARSSGRFPVAQLLKITWIGQFFSSVLPGSVSGDLIKILYVQKYDSNLSKKFLFASIFIDRLMGLSGLILLVGISSFFFSDHILENAPAMGPLLRINYLLVILVMSALIIFSFAHHLIEKILDQGKKLFFPQLWEKLIVFWSDLVTIKKQLIQAVALSIITQLIGMIVFWVLIYPFVESKMDFVQALAFIPLGLMTLALPVAPSGLGVGHAIFQKLFEFSGIENGASLFNLYFVVTLSLNVLGVIPYLLNKDKTKK